ncbi:MAG: TetR family transcriptional regulator [Haliea sp.]|jgi:AcrR family transcriptional regulator|nr:TetR family transcriptional regulator [Haliea sp.]
MSERKKDGKRTQAERREETRETLLAAACHLFGQQGYASTSLEEIAESCDMTIRPIYYHFGSKLGLFTAVHGLMELQALEALNSGSSVLAWEAFLKLCEDQAFRRITLEDGPNILGRAHWSSSQHFPWSGALARNDPGLQAAGHEQTEMCDRIARAAITEAAIAVIEHEHDICAHCEAAGLISRLLPTA